MSTIIETFPWGWIGTIGDNEIEIVSTMRDPALLEYLLYMPGHSTAIGITEYDSICACSLC